MMASCGKLSTFNDTCRLFMKKIRPYDCNSVKTIIFAAPHSVQASLIYLGHHCGDLFQIRVPAFGVPNRRCAFRVTANNSLMLKTTGSAVKPIPFFCYISLICPISSNPCSARSNRDRFRRSARSIPRRASGDTRSAMLSPSQTKARSVTDYIRLCHNR